MKGTYMNNKNKEICKEKFELMYVSERRFKKTTIKNKQKVVSMYVVWPLNQRPQKRMIPDGLFSENTVQFGINSPKSHSTTAWDLLEDSWFELTSFSLSMMVSVLPMYLLVCESHAWSTFKYTVG